MNDLEPQLGLFRVVMLVGAFALAVGLTVAAVPTPVVVASWAWMALNLLSLVGHLLRGA